jgi:hypothetical protein
MKEVVVHRDNIAKHGISEKEVEQCLQPGRRKYRRKERRDVYRIISQTFAGRYLEILYLNELTRLFVFHARDAKPWEVKLFKRRGKRS